MLIGGSSLRVGSSTHDKYGCFQNAQGRAGQEHGEALQMSPVAGEEEHEDIRAATGCVVWVLSEIGVDVRDSLCMRSVSSSLTGPGPFYFLFCSQLPSLSLNSLKSFASKGHPH